MNKENVVEVKMFGSFELKSDDCQVTEQVNNSKKMWRFLEYVISFRNKTIGVDDLVDVLWPDMEVKDPYNAIKNLLYRLRRALKEAGVERAQDLIIFKNNAFVWNEEIPCEFDFELFEKVCKEIFLGNLKEENLLEKGEEAIDLYRGDYLHRTAYDQWVLPINTYYHSLYVKLVTQMLELLTKRQEYQRILAMCDEAIKIDDLEEDFYYYKIFALIQTGKNEMAMKQYERTKNLFFDKLGVEVSDKFKELLKEMSKIRNNMELDLGTIEEDLIEKEETDGCFYCEYEFFKRFYQVQSRSMLRNGESVSIGLITIVDKEGYQPPLTSLSKFMKNLLMVISKSLRKGDVITRYSPSQYLILLPSADCTNAEKVMKRLVRGFHKVYPKASVQLKFAVREMVEEAEGNIN